MRNLIIGLLAGWSLGYGLSVVFLVNQNRLAREAAEGWAETIKMWRASEKEWQEKYEEAAR